MSTALLWSISRFIITATQTSKSLSRIYRPEGIDLCSRRYQEILHFCRDEYHIAEPALSGIYEAYLSELLHHFALLRAYAPARRGKSAKDSDIYGVV